MYNNCVISFFEFKCRGHAIWKHGIGRLHRSRQNVRSTDLERQTQVNTYKSFAVWCCECIDLHVARSLLLIYPDQSMIIIEMRLGRSFLFFFYKCTNPLDSVVEFL